MPLPDLEWFKGRANYLEQQNLARDEMFDELDRMRHGDWDLDDELQQIDWIHESRDPIFAQQSDSAKRILSDVTPSISLVPYDPGGEGKDIADRHEKALRWMLDSASRRRQATIVEDVVASAVDYGEVTAQVVYLPQQIKDVKAAGGNAKRYESMLRRGPFAVIIHNPRSVYARYSDMGAEEVLLITEDDPHNIVDLWGEAADELREMIKDDKAPEAVRLYDYTSYDYRCVWVEMERGGETVKIHSGEWPWPFLPWVCRIGGTSLEEEGEFQRNPLLKNMYHFDLYDDINRVRSLRFSDLIRTAAAPREVFQSDTRMAPDVDASSGDLVQHIDTEEDLRPKQPYVPDPNMSTLYAELRGDVQKSTLSEMLLGSEVPTGAAFASINLVTESAMKVIRQPQILAQNSLADILEGMLLYIHYDNSEAIGFGVGKEDRGNVYLISGDEIIPDNLYITVKIEADVPTDYAARTTTARQQIDASLNSRLNAMEDIGVKNATEVQEQIARERLEELMLQTELQNYEFQNNVALQEQMRQQIMQELMQNPEFLQSIAQQMSAGAQQEGRPGEPPRGAGQMPAEVGQETFIPPEANAAEGGPTTEEFAAEEIRRRQIEEL